MPWRRSRRSRRSTRSTPARCCRSSGSRLGRERADDAFQETFLRALRAYDRLHHGDHLRAWVLTIASRVAIDTHRRAGEPTDELPDLPHSDGRPAYEELAFLTDTLPPKERAAVVLRYGYDLDYEQIAAALDSSADAARQADLVRRPAPAKEDHMTVPTDLDRRFRDAAARAELLDAAYDVIDSELGPLLAAVTDRGLARISFDPEPEQELESLARLAGRRVLRAPRALDDDPSRARRLLRRPPDRIRPRARPARPPRVHATRPAELAKVPYGQTATYGELAERAGNPRASRAVGTVMNRNRIPIVLPVPPHRRLVRRPRRLRRRARAQGAAPAARGRNAVALRGSRLRRAHPEAACFAAERRVGLVAAPRARTLTSAADIPCPTR